VLLAAIAAALASAGALAALGYADNGERRPYLASAPPVTARPTATATAKTLPSTTPAPLGPELEQAQRLAAKYDASADQVASLRGGSAAARSRLVGALRTTAEAYRTAAAAAERGDVGAYASAMASAGDAKRDVSTALTALSASRSEEGADGGSSDSSDVGDSRSDDPSDDGPDP